MQRNALFEILEVCYNFKVLLEFAVYLREKIDLNQVQVLAKPLNLIIDYSIFAFNVFVFKLTIKRLEVRHIQHIIFLKVYPLNFRIALNKFRLHA